MTFRNLVKLFVLKVVSQGFNKLQAIYCKSKQVSSITGCDKLQHTETCVVLKDQQDFLNQTEFDSKNISEEFLSVLLDRLARAVFLNNKLRFTNMVCVYKTFTTVLLGFYRDNLWSPSFYSRSAFLFILRFFIGTTLSVGF